MRSNNSIRKQRERELDRIETEWVEFTDMLHNAIANGAAELDQWKNDGIDGTRDMFSCLNLLWQKCAAYINKQNKLIKADPFKFYNYAINQEWQ